MAVATRGPLIRRVRIAAGMAATIVIPVEQRHQYGDGYDVQVVIEVKRHRIRAAVAVSSGGELVLPDWLRKLLLILAEEQQVQEASIYLSTRPQWLVTGAQDEAARSIAERLDRRPLWDRLSERQRRQIAVRWLSEEMQKSLPAGDVDP
jgi:hypothetical protein